MAFGRKIELMVGKKNAERTKITDLKIEFEVTKTNDTKTNTNNAKISVYNCNENTSKQLLQAGNHVILKAGYKDEIVTTIILGDIVRANKKKDNTDTIIEIEVSDSRNEVLTSQVEISFAENSTIQDIVNELTSAINLPCKGTENLPGETFAHGYAFIGQAVDALQDVLNRIDFEFTIQNETIYIHKKNESVENLGLKLSSKTGLLTIPQSVNDKTDSAEIKEKAKNQWQFDCLLFPQLMPQAVCKVESDTLNAELLITEATFKGDNRDGDFIVTVKGEEL